jgi:predicted aldo/keto reductase-like oxidoreductase
MIRSEGLAEQFIWMSKAIHRVRELHKQETEITSFCKECSYTYPCPTIQALDGEQE